MAHALHDPVRHNAWATTQILEFCRGLDEQTLNVTVPGTYGTIIATLRHIIYCEIDFLDRLLGRSPTDPWQLGETTGLDALMERGAVLATDWEVFLASDVDSERPLQPDEGTNTIPAGIVIAVVLYHGSEHRGQICTEGAGSGRADDRDGECNGVSPVPRRDCERHLSGGHSLAGQCRSLHALEGRAYRSANTSLRTPLAPCWSRG